MSLGDLAMLAGALRMQWAFILVPSGGHTTRLVRAVLEPGSFVMERKMLLGIRERAERLAASTTPAP